MNKIASISNEHPNALIFFGGDLNVRDREVLFFHILFRKRVMFSGFRLIIIPFSYPVFRKDSRMHGLQQDNQRVKSTLGIRGQIQTNKVSIRRGADSIEYSTRHSHSIRYHCKIVVFVNCCLFSSLI